MDDAVMAPMSEAQVDSSTSSSIPGWSGMLSKRRLGMFTVGWWVDMLSTACG